MASREQVRESLDAGLDYEAAGMKLGVPAGQAYLIAAGQAADGSDAPPGRPHETGGTAEDQGVEQLVAQLRKHVAYEGQVFTRLREAVPDGERERLGRKIEAAAKKGQAS